MTPDLGGPHGNGVTQMALVGFDDQSYLELIAPVKSGVTEGSDWARFMSGDAGACAWAPARAVISVTHRPNALLIAVEPFSPISHGASFPLGKLSVIDVPRRN